jgi:hypothetical protein
MNCQTIKTQLDLLKEERRELMQELNAAQGRLRSQLQFELRSLNSEIARKQQQFNGCTNPPPPRPDLLAKNFRIKPNHVARTLEVAGVIQNSGDGPANGPFEVTFGVSYTDRNLTVVTRQLNTRVAAGVRIEGHGTEFVTESIRNLPLLYRSENPKFIYQFDMIVDSANQVSEVSEANNFLSLRYWATPPPA